MRIKRKVWAGVGVLGCIGAGLWMRELASWRPVTLARLSFKPARMEMFDNRFLRIEGVARKKSALDGAVLYLESMELKEGTSFNGPLQSRAFWRENNVGPPLSLNQSRTQLIFSPARSKPVILEGKIVPQFFDFDPPGEGAYYFAWFKERNEIYRKDEEDLRVWDSKTGKLKSHNRDWNFGILSPDGLSSLSSTFSNRGVPTLIRYHVPSGKFAEVIHRSKFGVIGINDGGWAPDGKFIWFVRQNIRRQYLDFNVVRVADSKLLWSAPCAGFSDWLPDGRIGLIQRDGFSWRDASGREVGRASGPLSDTVKWQASADGKWIYSAEQSGIIRRWRAR